MQVKKRDGRVQEFERSKLKGSLVSAGLTDENAESLVADVEVWMEGAAEEGVVDSQAIWEKVVEELEVLDPDAAEAYESFRE